MSKYQCDYPVWKTEPRPCDNPNEQPPVECSECCWYHEMEIEDVLLELLQKRYPQIGTLEECEPSNLVKPVCRVAICDEECPCLVRQFAVAGFDQAGKPVYCIVDQADRRFWL